MIDKEYSHNLRDVLDTGFDYVGPLFTEAEIDHLLYGDDEVNENFTTRLAEEGIYRSHGLRVDLSMQGPAVNNVVRITEPQAKAQPNNVYTVCLADSNKRKFKIGDQNYGIRHKVTQEDANVAVKSIDFPGRKVHATPLDLMTFDSGSNPIENRMIDQLTVCQALEVMGADTSDLIAHINGKFGITYAGELVRNACLAPIGDIGKFIATGGRPTACLAISPNMVSRFSIVSRPNVTPEDAGVPSIFFQRCSQNVKLIILITNMSRGFGACRHITFAANPGQFGKVTNTTMAGLRFETNIVGSMNSISASLRLPRTASEYLRNRQAAKTSISVAKRQVQRNVEHFMKIADVRSAAIYSEPRAGDNGEILSHQVPDPRQTIPTTSSASKVSSMLFSAFHNEDGHKWYMPASEICFVMLIAHHVCAQVNEVGTLYSNVCNIAGIRAMMGQINIAKVASSDAGCAEIFANAPDKSKICTLYLFCRHITLSKLNYDYAKREVRRRISNDRVCGDSRNIPGRRAKGGTKRESRSKIMLGPYYRYARMVNKVLANMKQSPCSNMERLGALISHGFTIRSIFVDDLAQALTIIRKETVEPDARDKKGYTTLKILTGRVRVQWSKYYYTYSQELTKLATCMPVMATGGERTSAEYLKEAEFESKASSPIFAAIAVEALAALGKALAYRFYYIGYMTKVETGSNIHETTKITYKSFLSKHCGLRAGDIVDRYMSVVSKMGQLECTGSAINEALDKSVAHFMSSCGSLGFKHEDVRAAIVDSYSRCEYTIKHSLIDMIKQDVIFVNGGLADTDLPDDLGVKGPTKLTSSEADTLAIKFCDATSVVCPGAAKFGVFATRKVFSPEDRAFANLKIHLESVATCIGNLDLALSTAMLNLSDNMTKDSTAHIAIIRRSNEIKILSSFAVTDGGLDGHENMYYALAEDIYEARNLLDTNHQNIMV